MMEPIALQALFTVEMRRENIRLDTDGSFPGI